MDGLVVIGIILFIAAFLFIGIEIMIPGFGAPGIIGSACLIAGIFLTAKDYIQALYIGVGVLVLLGIFVAVLMTLLSKGKFKSPIILKESMDREEGYISSSDLEYMIGKRGVTVNALHPAGRVDVEGVEFDVVSDGKFIEQGTQVEIYKVRNSSLVVKEI